jgi:hypothetical protein
MSLSHEYNAKKWMEEHPDAMATFMYLARRAAEQGRKFGIGLITERVRWEFQIERGNSQFKINNNHRAYIARELIRRLPILKDLIETRSTEGEV